MRVLHLTRDFPPRVNGGISRAVEGIVKSTRARGLEIAVLSFDAWRPKASATASSVHAQDGILRLRGPADLEAAQRFVEAFDPDVEHVHSSLIADAVEVRAPRVFSVHVCQAVQRRLRGLAAPTQSELAQARLLESADAIIAPSRSARDDLLGERAEARISVIGLGVNAPTPSPKMAPPTELLYVGRLADIKGTRELFEAMRRVDGELVVAGGLPDNQKAERRWRKRAPDNVTFVGWLDAEALSERYRRARTVIAPSWYETYGLAVAEAMSHGVPPIVADAGALPERVVHEQSGLIVCPRDPEELLAAIGRMQCDDALRDQLARGAARASEEWRWEASADAWLDVYASVLR